MATRDPLPERSAPTVPRRRSAIGRRPYSRHGLNALKARVKLRGLAAIDRRTVAARGMVAFRDELVAALGGDAALSPQRRKLIDLAARAALFLDHLDGWLTEQRTLVNQRSRAVVPVLLQRQALADHLARVLDKLGLDRVPQRVQSLDDLVRDIERQKATGAANGADLRSAPPDEVDRVAAGDGGAHVA